MAHKVDNTNSIALMCLDHGYDDNRTTVLQGLQKNISNFTLFNDAVMCETSLRGAKVQVILIVSGQLGQNLVPRIHDLPQLYSVLVYCMDKQRNKEWSKKYHKVS